MCEIGGKKKHPNSYSRDSDLLKSRLRSHFGPKNFELSAKFTANARHFEEKSDLSEEPTENCKNYHSESELSASRVLVDRRSSS